MTIDYPYGRDTKGARSYGNKLGECRKLYDDFKRPYSEDQRGMGFWDIKAFNQALLRNQFWCLVERPNYLIARVLKGCHFPREDAWSVGLGSTLSFTL